MSKTVSVDLFHLIKSLNKNEKGYIKKTFLMYGNADSNYIKLFNAIDKQEEYDEKKLLKTQKYITQLPRLKYYLYDKVLDGLESYYNNKNMDIQLRRMLNHVYILFEKGFYDQCKRHLYKAKPLTIRYEKFTQLLEILEWERTLITERQLVSDLDDIAIQEKEVLSQLQNLICYKAAYDQVSKLYTKIIFIRNENEDQQFKKLMPEKYFGNDELPLSRTAKILYYKTVAKYLSAFDNKEDYLTVARKAVATMENDDEYINQNILQYIRVLNNLIVTLSENNQHEEWKKEIDKLKKLPSSYSCADNEKIRSIVFMRAMIREFYHYTYTCDFEKSLSLIQKIESGLNEYDHLISNTHKLMFYYTIAYIYFIHGQLKESLLWVNKIINSPVHYETQAFHTYARLLNMIIRYENEDLELLDYLVRSTKKSLNKQEKLYQVENVFIRFMEDTLKTRTIYNEERLIEFRNTLLEMNTPMDYNILEYIDFISWAESKIQKRSFKEILIKVKRAKDTYMENV
jgi:hypothetical protein